MSDSTRPLISVLLPAYNAERFIRPAVDSILAQTFRDFELIILNDGSRDRTSEIIHTYTDDRIVVVEHANMGLGATLAKGLELAKGKYIARQDADDISLPERLSKQVNYLDQHPEIALLGSWAQIMQENGELVNRYHRHPSSPEVLRFDLVFNNPFVHSSVLFRKAEALEVGGYAPERHAFEDFDLWSRISRKHGVSNLPEVLLHYREVDSGISKSNAGYTDWVMKISMDNLKYYLPDTDEALLQKFVRIYHGRANDSDRISEKEVHDFVKKVSELVLPHAESKMRSELVDKHCFQMLRRYYNARIEHYDNLMESAFHRIRRKILFKRNSKFISHEDTALR